MLSNFFNYPDKVEIFIEPLKGSIKKKIILMLQFLLLRLLF